MRWLLGGGVAAIVLASASAAFAQWESSCRPPLKLAAGACVAQCPAGYEDRGSTCVYRNQSH